MSHHGKNPMDEPERKAMSEAMRKIFGEFPEGKLNPQDEGAISLMVKHQDGKVLIVFPKPVAWIGFNGDDAMALAQLLIEHAKAVGVTQGLVLRI